MDLTVKYKTIKPLEQNMRGNLKDLGLLELLDTTITAQFIKEKVDKLTFAKC